MKGTLSNIDLQLTTILKEAEGFHGHLGPFLVIGVRAGLIGLMRLGVEKGDPKLAATVMLKNSIPLSCILDGVQIATGCTIGNKRLRLVDSSSVAVRFENKNGEQIEIEVVPTVLHRLIEQLSAQNVDPEEVRKLGHIAASLDEQELFRVKLDSNSS